jgi:hypothetical protein
MEKPKFRALKPDQMCLFASDSDQLYYKKWEVDAYFDKLFKDAVRVRGFHDGQAWCFNQIPPEREWIPKTHQAILVRIEEIKPKANAYLSSDIIDKCPKCKIKWTIYKPPMGPPTGLVLCDECGEDVTEISKKLRAKWEVVD